MVSFEGNVLAMKVCDAFVIGTDSVSNEIFKHSLIKGMLGCFKVCKLTIVYLGVN